MIMVVRTGVRRDGERGRAARGHAGLRRATSREPGPADVAPGEIVWVCGGNGSGKSTLLRLIATALSPTFGDRHRARVLDLLREREEIRARVELLGHQPRFYGELTALENLRFVCRMYGIDAGRALPALERVGLDEVAGVRTASFSQGMRQRLALARCLMRDPDLILLDEPYAGLDVDARVIVDDLLADAERARSDRADRQPRAAARPGSRCSRTPCVSSARRRLR